MKITKQLSARNKGEPAWKETVFAVFDNRNLEIALEGWVEENYCQVWWGAPYSPDIIAIGYFASVIDRDVLGHKAWDDYCSFLCQVYNEDPSAYFIEECIIIDGNKSLEVPEFIPVRRFNMQKFSIIPLLLTYLNIIKTKA